MHVKELFGIPATDLDNPNLGQARCPFMGDMCDGGGNRYMAELPLGNDAGLRARFGTAVLEQGSVPCGICSVGNGSDWVVCPRRLLCFSRDGIGYGHERIGAALYKIGGFRSGARIDVWREIRVSYAGEGKKFQYNFDYIMRDADGTLLIIEVMTSSTSGGNKNQGTDIQTALAKSVKAVGTGEKTKCPSSNTRQVWARMASQLVAKSEAGSSWGGRTVWVIESSLAKYVQRSTGLDLNGMKDEPNEVNFLIVDPDTRGIRLAGCTINGDGAHLPRALDILRAPVIPPVSSIRTALRAAPLVSYSVP